MTVYTTRTFETAKDLAMLLCEDSIARVICHTVKLYNRIATYL